MLKSLSHLLKEISEIRKHDLKSEEDVKLKIMSDLLELLGYTKHDYSCEADSANERIDILVSQKFVIEVKKSTVNIREKEVKKQAFNYTQDKGLKYTLITNGDIFDLYSIEGTMPTESRRPLLSLKRSEITNKFGLLNYRIGKDNLDNLDKAYVDQKGEITYQGILSVLNSSLGEIKDYLFKDFISKYKIDKDFTEKIDNWLKTQDVYNPEEWLENAEVIKAIATAVGDKKIKWQEKYIEDKLFAEGIDRIINNDGHLKSIKNKWIEDLCYEGAYTIINRILFTKILQDRSKIGKKLSIGTIQAYRDLEKPTQKLFSEIFTDLAKEYLQIYDVPLFDHIAFEDVHWDDHILKNLVLNLENYNTKNIDEHILGEVYENYLEDSLKQQKGVFYTPKEVVNFILSELENDITKNSKILDLACGSGSFLLKAYDLFRNKKSHREILEGNLYGIDIDPMATQLCAISLALKNLNEKTRFFNIFVGDSVLSEIDPKQKEFIDEKVKSVKISNGQLQKELDIFENNQYDFVVGNPPYVNLQKTHYTAKKEFKTLWDEIYFGEANLLQFFIAQGIKLLKNNSKLGFITSQYWLSTDQAKPFREFLLRETKILKLIEFTDQKIFPKSQVFPLIIILEKESDETKRLNNEILYAKTSTNDFIKGRINYIPKIQKELSGKIWYFADKKDEDFVKKVESHRIKLRDIAYVLAGIKTAFDEAFEVTDEQIKAEKLEDDFIIPWAKGKDIKKYKILEFSKIICPYELRKDTDLGGEGENLVLLNIKNKNIYQHTEHFEKELLSRDGMREQPIYAYQRPRNEAPVFYKDNEKIIIPNTTKNSNFAYYKGILFVSANCTCIVKKENFKVEDKELQKNLKKLKTKYILGILNSSLIFRYLTLAGKKRYGVVEYKPTPLKQIPIPVPKTEADWQIHDRIVSYVEEILNNPEDKKLLGKIDILVEKIYKYR